MAALNQQSAMTTTAPLLQITKAGVVICSPADEFAVMRKAFVEQHWLLLPNFLDATLLDLIQKTLRE